MYQSNPELIKLQEEQASVEQKLQQLQHNQQRLENRKSYYEKANRKKRTHRLCTIAGTIESIAPDIKIHTHHILHTTAFFRKCNYGGNAIVFEFFDFDI